MKVPLLDLSAQNGPLDAAIREAMDRVIKNNRFILGPEVDAFEREIAAAIGVRHAIGVSSGTDALLVALMALDVGPGDEVVTTPFSFFATAGCIHRVGARPVFADIDPTTFNLDMEAAKAAIGPKTKAILPVHLFGQPCDVSRMRAIAGDIPIIEDAAQAIGATTSLGSVGALGTAGCFSFFPSKNLGCFGDGGLVTTEDGALADKLRVLRAHGAAPKYFHALVGGNFRIDALQAAVLRGKLPQLPAWTEGRRANAAKYDALFASADLPRDLLQTPVVREKGHVFNQYVIRTSRRDALQKHLGERGVETVVYYPKPLHIQKCFESLGYTNGAFPASERAANEVLALPIYPELPPAALEYVVETVVGFLRS
jgi:dTDP-4-amino-4,6-dideoxygalactose transaminase